MSAQSNRENAGVLTSATGWQQYVAFELGDRLYGVEITSVREIRQWSPTTQLPNQPHYGRGVLDIRGEVVPVHDLRARFGGPMVDVTDSHVILIVTIGGRSIGILVDAVSDIIDVSAADMRPVPEGAREAEHGTITSLANHGDRMIALLNLPALFGFEDMAPGSKAGSDGSINSKAIELVQESFKKIAAVTDQVADIFYSHLFEIAPETHAMFPDDLAGQKKKLMTTLALAINNLRNVETVLPALKALGAKHRGYGVEDVHYASVGTALLHALEQVLNSDWTPELKAAWSEIYATVANVMKQAAAGSGAEAAA